MSQPTQRGNQTREAELQPTRDAMAAAMVHYFHAHAAKVAEIDTAREANKRARAEGRTGAPTPAPLPPMGVAATVGLGKSRAVSALVEAAHLAGAPLSILVPTHELADEYAQRLAHLGAVKYQGRREPATGASNGPPVDPGAHACYRMVRVADAGDQNHRPAQGLCRQCPSGHAGVLKFVNRDEMRRERAEQFFKTNGIDPGSVPPCQFLHKGLPDQLAAPILIAPIQAFSEAIADWREVDIETGFALRNIQRLIVVDEHIPMSSEVEVHAGDINVWRNRLDALVERLNRSVTALQSKQAPTQAEVDELDQARAMRDLTPEIDLLFRDLGAKIAGDVPLGVDAERVIDMQKKVAKAGGSIAGVAAWEKVGYLRDEDDFFIPLRALSTLARNCKSGTLRQEKGALFAYETSPLIEWARDRGSVMFLDATMSMAMRGFIQAKGGSIHEASASQNMHVTRVMGHLYARGDVDKSDYPSKAQAHMAEIRNLVVPKLPQPCAVITHKAYLRYSQEAHQSADAAQSAADEFYFYTDTPIGWFGRHDRGLDAWGGRHLAIVGMPLLSKESIAGAYACTRAAMTACGIPWPEWDKVMDKEKADADGPPMPVMPEVRAWLVDEYAQGLAQAIGRNRAVNHPRGCAPLQVHLWGGLQSAEMDMALAKYGVAIHDSIRNPRSVSGPKPDLGAVDSAIEMVLSAGLDVSERSVRSALVGLRRSASTEAIRARVRELREIGALPQAKRTRVAVKDKPALQTTEKAPALRAAQSQNQGQETGVEARSISPFPSDLTAPNSHKDTNKGDSAQCDASAEPQKQGQEMVAERSFSPGFDPSDEELEDLLQQAAGDIEADLTQDTDPDDDPDDDPDPAGPGGPGGRLGARLDRLPGSCLGPAASPHIHHNTWRGGVSPPSRA
jgi:hypothetical protein